MAQKIHIILTDDLDGTEAAETVRFSLDGKDYEIDLNAENAEYLRNSVEPYRATARRAQLKSNARTAHATATGNNDTAKIRRWAKENGHEVADRGRIHFDVVAAYRAANS